MAIMNIGLIGLGRMGQSIAYRLVKAGYHVVGFDLNKQLVQQAVQRGVSAANSVAEVAQQCRIIWLMVPVGSPVDVVIAELTSHLQQGDIIVDGGNSKFTDSKRRAAQLKTEGIYFIDCGTSGGLGGREIGFSLMVGGDKDAYQKIEPLLSAIAMPHGYGYMGPSGAGHYVKMVHNGIEYGILQAYAEGYHLLKDGSYKNLDLELISGVWSHGSVIRSWINDLAHEIYEEHLNFDEISGEIAEGGTGLWTLEEAESNNIPMPVLKEALSVRAWSRKSGGNYATKLVALLRKKFGGHAVVSKKGKCEGR